MPAELGGTDSFVVHEFHDYWKAMDKCVRRCRIVFFDMPGRIGGWDLAESYPGTGWPYSQSRSGNQVSQVHYRDGRSHVNAPLDKFS